jgi:hypothetical protein
MTPFETAVEEVKKGNLNAPSVSNGDGEIPYFKYQLSVHKMNLKLMSKGIGSRGIKLKDLKHYYGLKGRSAVDCYGEFAVIFEAFTGLKA